MTNVHGAGGDGIDGLARFNVIVARKRSQSQNLIQSIEGLGGRAVAVPLIEVDLEPPSQGIDCVQNIGEVQVLVVTSANALKALAKTMGPPGRQAFANLPKTCYVIGEASAREAEQLGFIPVYFAGVKTGLEFAQQLSSILPPKQRIFLPQGNLASPEVAEVLRQGGHNVVTCTLYQTRDAPIDAAVWQQMLGGRKMTFLVLYSPSAAHSFYRQWLPRGPLDTFRVICIGPTTAVACRKLGIEAVGVAQTPTDDAVLRELSCLIDS